MSCHRTPEIVADHFDSLLSSPGRQAVQRHLASCPQCRAEIALLTPVQDKLLSWQPASVPEWVRGQGPATQLQRHPLHKRRSSFSWRHAGRWLPLAASLVLAVAVLTQTRLDVSEQGWHLSFGDASVAAQQRQLEAYMEELAVIQQQQNQQMLDAALQQFGDNTADTLVQLVDWFEQQRELDIQRVEAGFQQLLDRDFQTVSSMQQLASYVQYQGDLP